MLGQTGLVAGHQLLVQGVSESHHPAPTVGTATPPSSEPFVAVKEVTRGGCRIYTHINISIQKTSKNGKVDRQMLKTRFKCNYEHQLFAIKLIRLWPFPSDYIIFVSSK